MMSAMLINQGTLFGLFELDEAGTVLYSRVEIDAGTGLREKVPDVTGRNYFSDVAPFANAEELRLKVADFVRSRHQAGGFNFTCYLDGAPLNVKVLLARIRERTNGEQTKSVLVHIRKV